MSNNRLMIILSKPRETPEIFSMSFMNAWLGWLISYGEERSDS